jgi:hypothetical protein
MSKRQELLNEIKNIVFSFFIKSFDFNGIPLRDISKNLGIGYEESIELIKELVATDIVSIQSSTNPHIIGTAHYPVEPQIRILDDAKNIQISIFKVGELEIFSEDTDYPICVYPSQKLLKLERDVSSFEYAKYSIYLAQGEPQLKLHFFETDVIEKYKIDPRFEFDFQDFSGSIFCKYDEHGEPIVRKEEQIFLKSFGLGYDNDSNRFIAVLLRDLGRLPAEQQIYWYSKEVRDKKCSVLTDYYENVVNGSWITSRSIFSAFVDEVNAIYQLTKEIFGIPLFRKELVGEHYPQSFTFFFSPTSKNYYDFINLLDKYISENIDSNFFSGKIDLEILKPIEEGKYKVDKKGTLSALEEWLQKFFIYKDKNIPSYIMKPLKNVRKERQTPAHKIISNQYDKQYYEKQLNIMEECYFSLKSIRKNLQSHPKAKTVELSASIDSENIKFF